MDLASYAQYAVDLVNTATHDDDTLRTADDVRSLLDGRLTVAHVGDADVVRLRAVRNRLRAVFTHVGEDAPQDAIAVLNGLLAEFPPQPRITDHDGLAWHLHLADHATGAADAFAALAATGLAVRIAELGLDRLGTCSSPPCRNAFTDTSPNHSRRFCSQRCATRAHVAGHRARRRASQL